MQHKDAQDVEQPSALAVKKQLHPQCCGLDGVGLVDQYLEVSLACSALKGAEGFFLLSEGNSRAANRKTLKLNRELQYSFRKTQQADDQYLKEPAEEAGRGEGNKGRITHVNCHFAKL